MKKFNLLITITMFPLVALLAQSAGNALNLNGEVDYVWAPANVSQFPEGTLEMWFSSNGDDRVMLAIGGNGFPGFNFDGGYRLGEHSTAGLGLPFGFYTAQWIWVQSNLVAETGVWYHVACTWGYDGMKIYINGKLKGSNGYDGSAGNYAYDLIGASSWGDKFNGKIDELRYWNYARDSAQINETMWDTLSSEYINNPENGLVAYYKFDNMEDLAIDQDGQDDFRDFSMNGNHADSRGELTLTESGAFGYSWISDAIIPPGKNPHLQNIFPNPFHSTTTVSICSPRPEQVSLEVYNFLGEKITTLFSGKANRGTYFHEWTANDLKSGVYFLELVSCNHHEVRKVVLMR